jgi:dipeptidyl aminopeptidase/acylaminoacyl peptidase
MLAALFASSAHLPASAEPPFSIEEILSFSHPTELVAAPVGDRVAWVGEREGHRNLWVADGPGWASRSLAAFDGDDGQAISALTFTPDGETILFVRGGGPNRQGELPNPVSDPGGVEQTLWITSVDGAQAPRALLEAGAFDIFPDGQRLAFLRDNQIWVTTLLDDPADSDSDAPTADAAVSTSADSMTAEEENAEQLFTVRRGVASFSISPDGSRIAFVSDRGDYAFVGVYTLADQTLTWLDPSVDQDRFPAWSPDSSALAFLRIPNEREVLPFMPRREGLPFSIRVGDPETGQTREVFRADDGPGSAFGAGYWFVGDRLWWGADDRIVFPWEKTGWQHLWSVSSQGGEPVNLSPGAGEVQHAELSPDGRYMLYASNHGDIESRQLWQARLTGGQPERLTRGDGIEWAPRRSAETGTLVYLGSDATTPARPMAMIDGRSRAFGPALPDRFPADQLIRPAPVSFPAADGMTIPGQLFAPPERCGDGPHPGLLYFHGGSRRQMMHGFHPSRYYANAYAFNQTMASRCFVVLSVNFRSGVGYGLDFREALDYGAQGASEYGDVVGAGLYLAGRGDVDPARIGLWGGSYGGYLTALGLARASHLFAAGVDIHGVHDWNAVIENFVPSYDPQAQQTFAGLAFDSSPIADVANWTSPVLLIHGDDDRNVPFSETVTLVEALRRQGTPVETLVFPDEVHGFLLHRNWLAAFRASAAFLTRELESRE